MSLSTENNNEQNSLRLKFYLLWLLFSLLQAAFSNLIPDEAYYWKYSQALAWGYFDHPPVIAVMIKWGYFFIRNEVGVRLFSIVATMAMIYIIERLVQPKKLLLFYMAIASIAVLHIVSILAVPDVPLLFFTATFFLLYKRYTEQEKGYHILLLSLNIALLLLSKYHGILILFFTILSNLELLKKRSFWAIVLLSGLFFLPHVLWQWEQDLPSVKYHLLERNPLSYDISFTLNYLGGIPLIFVPATGIVLLYHSLKHKAANSFEKTMKYNLQGILIFFFIMSFRGRIEGNWIFYLLIPVVYLGYNAVIMKAWAERLIRLSFFISIALIIVARSILIDGLWNINTDFSGWKQWASDIQKEAGNEPVAFMNSYQKASEYSFYTAGGKAFSLNNVMGRKDQYNIWNYENEYQGKNLLLVSNYYVDSLKSMKTAKGDLQYLHIPYFHSSSDIRITTDQKEVSTRPGDTIRVAFNATVKSGSKVDADADPYYPMLISYQFFNKKGLVSNTVTDIHLTNGILLFGEQLHHLEIPAPAESGDYLVFISVSTGWLPPSINGGKIKVKNH